MFNLDRRLGGESPEGDAEPVQISVDGTDGAASDDNPDDDAGSDGETHDDETHDGETHDDETHDRPESSGEDERE